MYNFYNFVLEQVFNEMKDFSHHLKDLNNNADLYNVFPAFSYLINLLVSELPETKIYCILNDELKSEIKEFYKIISERNGVDVIELYNIDKINRHPTIKGMAEIREQVVAFLKAKQRI